MSILDAFSKHGMFSETLDTLNKDPSTAHQMKGFDFAQNFPTVAKTIGPSLAKGYQYGQEVSRALLDGLGGITIGDALSKAKTQSDANIEGMQGKGFNMADYQQNLQDFNIDNVTFANSFGLDNLFGSSAMANEPTSVVEPTNVVGRQDLTTDFDFNTARALENRAALNRAGLMALDDAGLITEPYETFTEVARPGFNKQFAKQLGTTALGLLTGNPFVGLIAKGLGALAGRGGLTGIRGGVDLRGDSTFDTFRRSTSFADFAQRMRDKRAREAAARRGELKSLQSRIDKGEFGGSKNGGGGFSGHGGYGTSAERGGALHG